MQSKFPSVNTKGREHLKPLGTDGKILFMCILKKSTAGSREYGTKKAHWVPKKARKTS